MMVKVFRTHNYVYALRRIEMNDGEVKRIGFRWNAPFPFSDDEIRARVGALHVVENVIVSGEGEPLHYL